jgi:membrane-associated phospholipid phosphatase
MLKISAQILSVVLHPLLMLTYMLGLLLIVNPYLFGINSASEGKLLVIRVFATTFILPAFAIFLMYRLKLISSVNMTDKQERIGPFIATGVFYTWVFRSVLNDSNMPTAFLIAALGTTIGLFACFLINLFFKISLHATGAGGFVGMVLITWWYYSYGAFSMWVPFLGVCIVSINAILILSILLAGAVGTARLLLGAHTSKELYAGFLLGLVCQYAALQFFV